MGSSEGFGGLSRKFLCTYTLKVSIKNIFTGGNDPQHLTAPEIALKFLETPKFSDFRPEYCPTKKMSKSIFYFKNVFR